MASKLSCRLAVVEEEPAAAPAPAAAAVPLLLGARGGRPPAAAGAGEGELAPGLLEARKLRSYCSSAGLRCRQQVWEADHADVRDIQKGEGTDTGREVQTTV